MKLFTRLSTAAALIMLCASSPLTAQAGRNPFSWYIGGTGGVLIFETPRQERAGIPMVGANFMITARKTALLLSIEEGLGSDEVTSYIDPSAGGGARDVSFNDIRRYSAILLAYPLKSHAQPYVGLGLGLMHIHNPMPAGPFATPDEQANARATATSLGSFGYATGVVGLQLQAGGIAIYGQYQITSTPSDGKLTQGPMHSVVGGLRISLGGAKEGLTGGGY